MNKRKDGRVRTDTQGYCQNHRQSENRGFQELSIGKFQVIHKRGASDGTEQYEAHALPSAADKAPLIRNDLVRISQAECSPVEIFHPNSNSRPALELAWSVASRSAQQDLLQKD